MTTATTTQRNEAIRAYVVGQYIETGKHLFVADIAKHFNTNALAVRNALGYDDFIFEEDDRWSGNSFSGRFIQCACVEPTKSHLVQIIRQLTARAVQAA
jgi:hypothetical protein